mmetsp:Transcript_103788/g.332587  ORF Transcript_103788/g.332587 Transcript_103788/m.332587 type:complete len:351 (-) Transcript_103788:312-1364(-)
MPGLVDDKHASSASRWWTSATGATSAGVGAAKPGATSERKQVPSASGFIYHLHNTFRTFRKHYLIQRSLSQGDAGPQSLDVASTTDARCRGLGATLRSDQEQLEWQQRQEQQQGQRQRQQQQQQQQSSSSARRPMPMMSTRPMPQPLVGAWSVPSSPAGPPPGLFLGASSLPTTPVRPPPGLEGIVPTPRPTPMAMPLPTPSGMGSTTRAAHRAMHISALQAAHLHLEDGSSSETCSTADTEPMVLPSPALSEATTTLDSPPPLVLALSEAIPEPFDARQVPSMGSAGHAHGKCKPCAFLFKDGCMNGARCEFCHLCPPDERKRRKQQRSAASKEQREVRAGKDRMMVKL